jgi:Pirin C-terminal cupin domain
MVVEDETITSNCHVEEIERFSRANIKSYIAAREGGSTPWWKSIESLSGQVANEYQGRVLYELIQNASDAHSRAGAAAGVRICLDRSGPRYIWWNFVSSRRERIEQAKEAWKTGKFAPVPGETEFIPLPET